VYGDQVNIELVQHLEGFQEWLGFALAVVAFHTARRFRELDE